MSAPKKKAAKRTGKPGAYTIKIGDEICERLAEGESLRSICQDRHMPSKASVFRWIGQSQKFRDQYARAREAQADTLADEIIYIADNPVMGEKTKVTSDGKREVTTGDMIEHRRLQIDARKWYAGKLRPKVYGTQAEPESTGASIADALASLIDKLPS